MEEQEAVRKERRVALLATPGLKETDVRRALSALSAAGIRAEPISAAPQDYAALVIPGSPEQVAADGFMRSIQAAGKPVLYLAPPASQRPQLLAHTPPPLNMKTLWAESWRNWNAIDAPRLGAALAYYTLLSLAPLVVLIVSIAGVFFRRSMIQSGLIWQVRSLMGNVAASLIQPVLENSKATGGIIAGLLSILTLLLGASGVFLELRDSLDTVWGVRPNYGSGLWSLVRERLFAFLMLLCTGLILSVSMLLSVILATPIRFLLRFLPTSGIVSIGLSTVLSIAVLMLVFALIFKVVPDIDLQWSDVWIGALVTSVLFVAGKWVIALYLTAAGVGSPYAAAGSLIVFLTWVYYSVQIFLLGAEFTHEYALRHGSYSQAAH